ncbi:HpcH/HpaI aldolase family protein [Neobacillus drentensis]|uniref:HpcH/HpaI aldolase family protein n=1 Tax=Neobacillus drentensis TaxID=220684 RepID=UPI0008257D23|nr:aldolase/citrate lyase family protein [Neobacillus drentensis]
MSHTKRIDQALQTRGFAVGTFISFNSPDVAEFAGHAGFDFILLDAEHSTFAFEGSVEMIRAAAAGGTAAVVRLPSSEHSGITKILDAGAAGVLIANVRTGEEARRIVQAAKYGPAGKRGYSPSLRAMDGYKNNKEYREWSDNNLLIWVIIESEEALENIEDILDSGITGIMPGPYDLSMAMGYEGDTTHPEVVKALYRVSDLAVKKGVDLAVFSEVPEGEGALTPYEIADSWKNRGARFIHFSTDRMIMASGYRRILDGLKESQGV